MSNAYELMRAEQAFSSANGDDIFSANGDDIFSANGDDIFSMNGKKLPKRLQKGKGMTQPRPAGRVFTMTIVNATANQEQFYILPSAMILDTEKGHPLSGQSVSGATLTFTGVSAGVINSLKYFYRFIATNPTLAYSLRTTSNKPDDQYTGVNNINVSRFNDPSESTPSSQPILVSQYQDPANNNKNIIKDIPFKLSMDSQTQAVYSIAPNSVLTLTIEYGIIVNTGDTIQRAANNA